MKNLIVNLGHCLIISLIVFPLAANEQKRDEPDYNKKAIILIKEDMDGIYSLPGQTMSETIIQELFRHAGFSVITSDQVKNLFKQDNKIMNGISSGVMMAPEQKLLLEQNDVNLLIYGSANTWGDSQPCAGQYLRKAIVSIKVVDVRTGMLLGNMIRQGNGLGENKQAAFRKALENTIRQMIGQMDSDKEPGKFIPGPFMKNIIKSPSNF